MEGYGATVQLSQLPVEELEEEALHVVERTNGVFVHPSNDLDVMNGQGTVALELLEQAKDLGVRLDAILVPAGGGGLLSGVAMVVKVGFFTFLCEGILPEGD